VAFGFGKGKRDDDDDDEEEQVELVLFQGAVNGKDANLAANARLVQAGLMRAKELISDALSRRGEMIRLEPKDKVSLATFFVDGIPYPGARMPPQAGLAVTQMVKLLAGLDIQVRDKPQSGGIKAEYQEVPYTLRVNTFPIQGGGERLIVRAENQTLKLTTMEELGFGAQLKQKVRDLAIQKNGIILAAGPPMSGVTTAAFAMVRAIDAYLYTVYNLADTEAATSGTSPHFRGTPETTCCRRSAGPNGPKRTCCTSTRSAMQKPSRCWQRKRRTSAFCPRSARPTRPPALCRWYSGWATRSWRPSGCTAY
jgi:type IV pilus assembly protein PilB